MIPKKAFEIAYALFRIGDASGNPAFQSAIQGHAVNLLNAASLESNDSFYTATKIIPAIRQFLMFGSIAGLLKENDAELVIRELDTLNTAIESAIVAIRQSGNRQLQDLKLEEILSKEPKKRSQTSQSQRQSQQRELDPATSDIINRRQAKVIERIRQIGNCRLRDMEDYLPDVSERTLRYDLQDLMAKGKIERFGGGPTMHYRLRSEHLQGAVQAASSAAIILPPPQTSSQTPPQGSPGPQAPSQAQAEPQTQA